MAIQIWQQILLSDPKNTEALAGIAKDYKLTGAPDKASDALDRLRAISPNDPNIAKIEGWPARVRRAMQLRQAGDLARAGQARRCHAHLPRALWRSSAGRRYCAGLLPDAVRHRRAARRRPLPACAPWPRAIQAIRVLPSRWAPCLPTMPETRAEGIRILKEHAKDPDAQAALRQALVWDSANPASADGAAPISQGTSAGH